MTILAGHGEKAMATSPENGFLQETRFLGELQERRNVKTLQNTRLMLLSRVHHNWQLFGSLEKKIPETIVLKVDATHQKN